MTEVIANPQSLTKDEVWREIIRSYVDTGLVGEKTGVSDDELAYFLDPATAGHITQETKLVGHSMTGPDGAALSVDSLDIVETVMDIEERFEIAISEDDLNAAENAGAVLDIVWKLLHPEAA